MATQKTNIQTNLLGRFCSIREITKNPHGDRCIAEQADNESYEIMAVFLPEGAETPTVAIAEFKLGGGDSNVILVYLDQITLHAKK